MACCALAAFLITQWIVLFRAIRRTIVGWHVPRALLVAGVLFAGVQSAAFMWKMVQPGHEYHSMLVGTNDGTQATPPLMCGENQATSASSRRYTAR